MYNDYYIYEFAEFRLDEEEKKLFKGGKKVNLQPKAFQVLLLLVKNAGRIVSNEKILREVWQGSFVEENNINIQVNAIRNALGQNRVFIATEEKAFKFTKNVDRKVKLSQNLVRDVTKDEQKNLEYQENTEELLKSAEFDAEIVKFNSYNWLVIILVVLIALLFLFFGNISSSSAHMDEYQLGFIYMNSFFYGALSAITLILESAYEFDKYKQNVARMAPFVFLINATAMFAGLKSASEVLPENIGYAFFLGLLFLSVGTYLSCLLAYFVLPNTPITKSKEEKTQPAFFAFFKNVGFYFFAVYLFFGLFIYCLTYGSAENYKNMQLAFVFLLIWGILTLVSWISINLFNSNLKTVEDGNEYKYHSLFVSMSYLRLVFCSLPTLINIGIYFFLIK